MSEIITIQQQDTEEVLLAIEVPDGLGTRGLLIYCENDINERDNLHPKNKEEYINILRECYGGK